MSEVELFDRFIFIFAFCHPEKLLKRSELSLKPKENKDVAADE